VKLIVADDERPARFLLRSMLEELGIEGGAIHEAANGAELVEAASRLLPDCAFVDIKMPVLDGLAAIERSAPSSPGTKWVVATSYGEFDYALKALRLGVTEYLLKPIRPEELAACLERLSLAPGFEEDAKLAPVVAYLRRNFNADASVAGAAEIVGLTPNYLSALFRKRTGSTISDYLARLRMDEAGRLIREEGLSVAAAAKAVGYSDLRFFARKFKAVAGVLPSRLKQGRF
jgi:two-component system, response regulator YesN